jgi:hypothetical protein
MINIDLNKTYWFDKTFVFGMKIATKMTSID